MNARGVLLALAASALFLGVPVAGAAQGPAPSGRFITPPRAVWAGEVFDLTLAWRVNWNSFQNLDGEPSWKPGPLVTEPWGAPELGERTADGWVSITRRTRAMALQPGRAVLAPAQQAMVVQTGVVDMDEYKRAVTGIVTVRSATEAVEVRALPPAPAGFSGAVGEFTVASTLDMPEVKVGDTLTWTVSVSGTGNWPAFRGLPPRQVSRDFQLVGAPKLVEDKDAMLFKRTLREQVMLIPQRAGPYVLSAFEVVAFDPRAGRYVTLRAPAISLTVLPGPHGDLAPPPSPLAATPTDALPNLLAGSGAGIAPLPGRAWFLGLVLAPLSLLATWLLLAWRHAWVHDPDRAARAAHVRLGATLDSLARASDAASTRGLVRAWQRDTGLRFKLGRAAPTPASFASDLGWAALWAEAERFLYARAGALPEDWRERARARLTQLGAPPPFAPITTFKASNLRPVACLVAAMQLCVAPPAARAAPAAKATSSESALREQVAARPLDWRARHNLAVVLAAKGRWDEAAGQAAAAWLQQPASPNTRALWLRTAAKAGYSLDPRASVPRPGQGWSRFTGLASPPFWQRAALCLAWACAAGLAAALVARFFPRWGRGWMPAAGLGLAAVAASGTLAAVTALHAYGPLARPGAAILSRAGPLRALPVDTPAEDAHAQLPAGAAGWVDRTFLGWRRLRLDDGRTGWVRLENLVFVWSNSQ